MMILFNGLIFFILYFIIQAQPERSEKYLTNMMQLNKNLQIIRNGRQKNITQSYSHNYDIRNFEQNPTALISIRKYDCESFTDIDYRISSQITQNLVIITFSSSNMNWFEVGIVVWLTSHKDFYTNTIQQYNLQPFSTKLIVINYPYYFSPNFQPKTVNSLNLINSLTARSSSRKYGVSVYTSNRTDLDYTLAIRIELTTFVKYIKISYLIYDVNTFQCKSEHGYIIPNFAENNNAIYEKIINSPVQISQWMIGLDMLLIDGNQNLFLKMDVDSDGILQISTPNFLPNIRTVYIVIAQINNWTCENKKQKYLYKGKCLLKCPSNTYEYYNQSRRSDVCLSCSSKLKQKIDEKNKSCVCISGYVRDDLNRCIQIRQLKQVTPIEKKSLQNTSTNLSSLLNILKGPSKIDKQNKSLSSQQNSQKQFKVLTANNKVMVIKIDQDSSLTKQQAKLLPIVQDIIIVTKQQKSFFQNDNKQSVYSLDKEVRNVSKIEKQKISTKSQNERIKQQDIKSTTKKTIIQEKKPLAEVKKQNKSCNQNMKYSEKQKRCVCDDNSVPFAQVDSSAQLRCYACELGSFKINDFCIQCVENCLVCQSATTCKTCKQNFTYDSSVNICERWIILKPSEDVTKQINLNPRQIQNKVQKSFKTQQKKKVEERKSTNINMIANDYDHENNLKQVLEINLVDQQIYNGVKATVNQTQQKISKRVTPNKSICGNQIVQADQECDDGNSKQNDGCSSKCMVQNGYICKVPSNVSKSLCLQIIMRTDELITYRIVQLSFKFTGPKYAADTTFMGLNVNDIQKEGNQSTIYISSPANDKTVVNVKFVYNGRAPSRKVSLQFFAKGDYGRVSYLDTYNLINQAPIRKPTATDKSIKQDEYLH